MNRAATVLGAVSALIGVAAGAFGSHALRGRLEPAMLGIFEIGVRYQLIHAVAMILAGLLHAHRPVGLVRAATWLFAAGTLLFSGSLYAMTLTGARALGAITPLGGGCFIAGWACLALAAWRKPR